MSYCNKCGKQNPGTAKFCTGCGETLSLATVPAKKKSTLLIVVAAVALAGLTAAYFLFIKKPKKAETTATVSIENRLKDMVHQWDAALNKSDALAAASLYADNLVYYRTQMSRAGAQDILYNFFNNNYGYSQQIKGEISIEKENDNLYICNFNKSVTQNGKVTDYPSYLKFSKQGDGWRIVEEGDKITDYNLNKNK